MAVDSMKRKQTSVVFDGVVIPGRRRKVCGATSREWILLKITDSDGRLDERQEFRIAS